MDILEGFNGVFSTVLLAFCLVGEAYVAVKSRMRLDPSMVFIMVTNLLSFILRTSIYPIDFNKYGTLLKLLAIAASLIYQISMYYLVFQMRKVRDIVCSDSKREFKISKQQTTRV